MLVRRFAAEESQSQDLRAASPPGNQRARKASTRRELGGGLVSGLYDAKPYLLGGNLVDGPARRHRRRFGLLCHAGSIGQRLGTSNYPAQLQPASDRFGWRTVASCRRGTASVAVQVHSRCPSCLVSFSAVRLILETTLMKIFYWTLKSIPELSGLPSNDERLRVWRDANSKMARRSGLHWVSLVASLAVCIKIGDVLIGHPPLGTIIGLLVAVLIYTLISLHLVRPYIRTLLSAEQASVRLPTELLTEIDRWAADNESTRSDAIRAKFHTLQVRRGPVEN